MELTTAVKELLVQYFRAVDVFSFGKATDLMKSKSNLPPPFSTTLSSLILFASCERIYFSLSYLESKWIRKDHLNLMYQSVLDELAKALLAFDGLSRNMTISKVQREDSLFFSRLIQELTSIVKVRSQLIAVYRTLSNFKIIPAYKDIISFLEKLELQVQSHIALPILDGVKFNMNSELYILHKLLLCQLKISEHQFKDTVFNMHQARVEIDQWRSRHEKDFKADATKPARILLVGWLQTFHSGLNSKMGLYFYNVFQRQERELGLDVRGLTSRLEINYPLVLESFCQRLQCKHALVVFEASGMSRRTLDLEGYSCPIKYAPPESVVDSSSSTLMVDSPSSPRAAEDNIEDDDSPLMGLKSYPAIFCHPPGEPLMHFPNIISLIQDNRPELNKFGLDPVYCFDEAVQTTYFLMKIEPRVYIVLIFGDKKKQSDTAICDWLAAIAVNLRNCKIFEKLIPKT